MTHEEVAGHWLKNELPGCLIFGLGTPELGVFLGDKEWSDKYEPKAFERAHYVDSDGWYWAAIFERKS